MNMPAIPPDAAQAYRREGWVMLPRWLRVDDATALWNELRELPTRRVMCGLKNVTWLEQKIEAGTAAYDLFQSEPVLAFVRSALDLRTDAALTLRAWTSVYARDEYINPHRDRSGAIHLVIALRTVAEENGGALVLEPRGGRVSLQMDPGDALLFDARGILHFTTPLRASEAVPWPERVVAVGRYYVAPDGPGTHQAA